jgi:NodT family efflux transporter outer membrane factor (OMF) lipoprotein
VGFDASWEADLWGRVRRSVEQAQANVDVSAETAHSVLITAQAELARDYVQLRGLQAQMDVVDRTLTAYRSTLQLVQQRFANGLTTETDVTNEQALLASTQAQLPNLQQQEQQTINAIALLIGAAPGALRAELLTEAPVPPVPPVVPVGVPSELTRRRPDIRAAEAQLHAATAGVGVAVADFYPRVTLSASAALQALQPHYLGDWGARTFGVGPGITLPIFEGGTLTRTLELRQSQQVEAAVHYQQTVLQALHDVDNALIAYGAEEQRRSFLASAVTSNRRTLAVAQERYQGGLGDFLTVLDAERQLLGAEQSFDDSTTRISVNLVALCKALGGGWNV